MLKKLGIASALVITILLGLYGYFVHSYSKVSPPEAGTIKHQSLNIDGLQRSFQYYLPEAHPTSASLLFVLHGSMGSSDGIRWQTAYEFERLAAKENIIVVYPDGFENHWNDCRSSASYSANTNNIDDIAFFKSMINYFSTNFHIDTSAVFATGLSNGGHMAYKLGLTMPESFKAIAPVIANIPVTENLDCTAKGKPLSVAIFNGKQDPINPFEGGKVVLFGNDSRGSVLSSEQSIHYWATLASDALPQGVSTTIGNNSTLQTWEIGEYQFRLYHLEDSGHVFPSSQVRFGRLMGPNNSGVEASKAIWEFFSSVN